MRKRFQQGGLLKRNGSWVGQWWENGHRRKRKLGPISQMTKAQAQIALAAIVEPINARTAGPSPNCKLCDFVQGTFFPFYRRKWKRSTAATTEDRIERHILAEFGSFTLSSFNEDQLQDFIDRKSADGLSASTVAHLRWDLKQIFDVAVAKGYLARNPAKLLFIPRGAHRSEKLVMNFEEVITCLQVLDLRERLIVKLATIAGMRPGEILALKWGAVKQDHCEIQIRIYRGEIDTPKTEHSVRKVALSASIIDDFNAWKEQSIDTSPEAWVFPSENGRTTLWRDNVLRRGIYPKLEPVGLSWVNFQVMRRTHASLMNELEVDPKIVAEQMGHTLDVNQNVYTKVALRRRGAAVKILDEALRKSLSEPIGAKRDGKQSQAIENMERETGIEPATSSLGTYPAFVNKQLMRSGCCILIISIYRISSTSLQSGLNGVTGVTTVASDGVVSLPSESPTMSRYATREANIVSRCQHKS